MIVGRHPGLRGHLFRHHGRHARRLRRLAAAAVRCSGSALYVGRAALLRAAPGHGWRKAQADARSLMTGRITDAYTNIATVKLFSHAQREAGFARSAMQEFLHTVHRQMRLVSGFEIVNHVLSDAADRRHRRRGAVAVDARRGRRRRGRRGHGDGAAPERHLALGDVGDGQPVRAHRHGAGRHQHAVAAAHGGRPRRRGAAARSRAARCASRTSSFAYGGQATRDRRPARCTIRPGEKIGLVGRSGAGKIDAGQPAAALLRPRAAAAS